MNLLIEGSIVKGVPVAHVHVGRGGVILPVSDTIANSEALKVGLEDGVVFSVSSVMLVDVVSHVGHVDSSIRLSREPEVVLLELRVLFIPGQDDSEVVLARRIIIESAVFDSSASGVPNSSRLVNPKHVHLLVPGLRVLVPRTLLVSRLNVERSVLLSEAEHGGASRTTIGPDHHRRVSRVSLSLGKDIVDSLGCVRESDVARV